MRQISILSSFKRAEAASKKNSEQSVADSPAKKSEIQKRKASIERSDQSVDDSPVKKPDIQKRKARTESSDQSVDDSPVKKPEVRKRKARIESSDEEEENLIPSKSPDKHKIKKEDSAECNSLKRIKKDSGEGSEEEDVKVNTKFDKDNALDVNVSNSAESTEKEESKSLEKKSSPESKKVDSVDKSENVCKKRKIDVSAKETEVSNETTDSGSNNDVPATKSSKLESEKKSSDSKKKLPNDSYDPSKNNYHPINDACWKKNEKVPYLALAKTLDLIEHTSGRLKTIEILSNFFRSVIALSPNDLLQSVYLCLNQLAPEYEGIELGIGETLLMKAVAQATGRTVDKIKAEVAIKGDLGIVSESSRGNQRVMFAPPKLTVASVFSKFLEIAKMSGNAVMSKKVDKIQALFVACRDCEAKYIIRSLSGKLRIGLAEQSVLAALARAATLTPPEKQPDVMDRSKGMSADSFKQLLDSQTLILKTTYCECPNYDLIVPVLLKHGLSALPKHCQIIPGRPVKPMLAQPTNGIKEVLERFDKNAFTCEFKYDGERAQIHMTEEGEIKIFSRNQEDNTSKYPDIISRLPKSLKEGTKSFILDSESVAWDKQKKQILPFQVLSTRKRKDAVESEIVVQVCIMAFDLLYLNGESLVKKSLKERRELLHTSFLEIESEFMFAHHRDGNTAETMQEFLDESVKGSCEGLMVKALEVNASYEIAKRSHNWLKLKKDYLEGVGDTLDLLVIGGYFGKGKRTGSYGGFLLACYDEDNEEYQSICKLGTGFKDEDLEAHTAFFKEHIIDQPKSYYRFDSSVKPDVWFEPAQIWEIKCADLSISPVHKAAIGIVDPEKGISLRFPRFVRIRTDKSVEECTNSTQVAEFYQKQEQIQNTKSNTKTEEDYY